MKAELLFTSKKYVIFSWQMIGVLIYFAFLSYCYYIEGIAFALFMGVAFLIPLGLISLSRFFYVHFYENHIEVKHLFIPFFRQKININELEAITHEGRHFGGHGGYRASGPPTYIPCMVIYFNALNKRDEKVYWHVSSLYKNYQRVFYENMRKIIDQKQCNFIAKNRKYYPKSTYDKRTFTRIIEVPQKTKESLYVSAINYLHYLAFDFGYLVAITELTDYKQGEIISRCVFSTYPQIPTNHIRQTIAMEVKDNELKLKITEPYYKCVESGNPDIFEPLVAEDGLEIARREWEKLADSLEVYLQEDKKLPFASFKLSVEFEKEIDYEANN